MPFELFDVTQEFEVTAGTNLPHWYQPGVTYFVTFRTEDSLPKEVADRWRRSRDEWMRRHGIDPAIQNWESSICTLPITQQREFYKTFADEYLALLDKGYGECPLKRPDVREIIFDALNSFHGNRYFLGDVVVMPNHVHLLACLLGDVEITRQCYSWKKYTATKINQILNRKGRFWQEESFDHLVRSPEQFEHFRHYIANNGFAAGLDPNHYRYQPMTAPTELL